MLRVVVLAHRWTGIVLALYVVTMGLSGAVLVFHDEAAHAFRAPQVAPSNLPKLDVDQIVERIHHEYPDWHLQTLWWPGSSQSAPWFAEIRKGAVGVIGETALAVYVHPQTGEILYVHNYSKSTWRWLQLLHFNLAYGRDGRTLNGVLAVSNLFATLTGVLLWPRLTRKAGSAASTNLRRQLWRSHYQLGLAVTPFVIAVTLTGSYFAWRSQVGRAIAVVAPMRFMNSGVPPLSPAPQPPLRPIASFEPAIHQLIPDYPITRVLFPDREDQPLRFEVYEGSRNQFFKASNLFFNPETGELVRADLVKDRMPGDSIVQWIGALHFGAFGGMATKIIWSAGALALSLVAASGPYLFFSRRR